MLKTKVPAKKVPAVEAHNWSQYEGGVKFDGQHIVLPANPEEMPLDVAEDHIRRLRQDQEQKYRFFEKIDAYPHDAAVAFQRAMVNLFGWSSPQSMMTWFGKRPPEMLRVSTGPGPNDFVQVPQGSFKVPNIEDDIQAAINTDENFFYITASIKKKDQPKMVRLVEETRRLVREESIYRGKAIQLRVDEDGDLMVRKPPEFIDATKSVPVILDDLVMNQVKDNLLVPIKFTQQVKALGIPLKRGVLLEGQYGTGKTLIAKLVANVCYENGWTYILLDRIQGLRAALEFAKRYSPAVVFAEDIDRIADERDDDTNDLINTIDGVVSKDSEIMTVLTTNFVEKLDPVILRPGRLDAVISIRAPQAEAVERLIRFYAGELLDKDENLASLKDVLKGQIPATIREVVERSKLGSIGRGASTLSANDLLVSAETMKNHMALLAPKLPPQTAAEKLSEGLQEVLHIGNGSTDYEGLAEGLADQINKRGGMMIMSPKKN